MVIFAIELKYTKDMMLKQDIENSKRQAEARALEKGRAEGRAEGLQTRSKEIAEVLKTRGMSNSEIAEITGLTTEQIEVL